MHTISRFAASPPGLPASTVLVVDDSPVNLRLIAQTLQGQGYRILAARTGRAAIDIAQRTRPDLVLLDVMMPDLDGFEVCRALKANPATRECVVIFLSALGEVADKVAGLELGAADYITKPIQAEEVLARVANHLARLHLEREVRRGRDALERELDGAARMQRLLLPAELPATGRVGFAAHYRTSRYAGGDYYDVLPLPGGRYGIFVADVSGHGAPAAIVMAMIRAVLHGCPRETFGAAEVLQHLNTHFQYLWDTPMFATALCGVLDPDAARLTLACAGHPLPLRSRRGLVEPLACANAFPLLMMEMAEVSVAVHDLEPGDRVLFFTDGVTERQGPGEAMYEDDRLTAALARAASLPLPAVVASLVDDLDAFAGPHEAHDDQTLLLLGLA